MNSRNVVGNSFVEGQVPWEGEVGKGWQGACVQPASGQQSPSDDQNQVQMWTKLTVLPPPLPVPEL